MAERNPPAWLQDGSHPADLDRRILESVFRTEGVLDLSGGDLLVTEQAAPTMGVTVAAGVAVIDGTESTSQGLYHVVNDADVDLAIAAADPTNPRIDLVIARVYDSFYGTAVTDEWALEVVTGTPAASPDEPTVPDNSHVLARVDVGADPFSAVSNAEITDRRELAVPGDGGLRAIVRFTADDTFDKADYPWLRAVRIRAVGGGGGGAGAGAGDTSPGGGSGAYAESFIPASDLAASETVTVGTGGAAGSTAGNGGGGGQSSFGSLVSANGGGGGSLTTYRGVGGGAATGDFTFSGEDGDPGGTNAKYACRGGTSPFGGGGRGARTINPSSGQDGRGYGSGGGGAYDSTPGGAGASGLVVVELYG